MGGEEGGGSGFSLLLFSFFVFGGRGLCRRVLWGEGFGVGGGGVEKIIQQTTKKKSCLPFSFSWSLFLFLLGGVSFFWGVGGGGQFREDYSGDFSGQEPGGLPFPCVSSFSISVFFLGGGSCLFLFLGGGRS